MTIHFYKYHGTGNDFVILDNRNEVIQLSQPQIAHICHRRFGVGADGLMELRLADGYDFKMVYYNADGNPGSMCGNGGRCLVQFAHHLSVAKGKQEYTFLASDGPHHATVEDKGIVRLKMNDVATIEHHNTYELLNTGSPHFVKTVNDLKSYNVVHEGKQIRNSSRFKAEGVNVNFVETTGEGSIFVRTYERGVEDETYSCGTGVTAAAIVNAHNDRGFNHVEITTLGGKLYVEFDRLADDHFTNVWLAGPGVYVFEGIIKVD